MKLRIGLWAIAGFLVAGGWAVYAFASAPPGLTFGDPLMTLVEATCPIAILGRHYPISVYMCLLANAATYGLIGLTVETLRHRHAHAK
jgi:hypothetical protein